MFDLDLRQATKKDANFLWELRNDDLTRANSFNHDKVAWHDHLIWLDNTLRSDVSWLLLAENACKDTIGQIRFDKVNDRTASVSFAIAADFRGKGYGRRLLEKGLLYIQDMTLFAEITAFVQSRNDASLRLFDHVGFLQKTTKIINEIEYVEFFKRIN
jgi:RimJ/RimL family protein N-acetyltransferase